MKKFEDIVVVDPEWGTIEPYFNLGDGKGTSGKLKYFQKYAGKKVKITIEVLDE